jgi:hypothetical protein
LRQWLGRSIDYSKPDTSLSLFHSDVGLGIDGKGGVAALFFHYNRVTTRFQTPFLAIPTRLRRQTCDMVEVFQTFAMGRVRIAFCDHNTWIVDCRGLKPITWRFGTDAASREARRTDIRPDLIVFDALLPTLDRRDPDPSFPMVLGIRMMRGSFGSGDGIAKALCFRPDAAGRLALAFSIRLLDVRHEEIVRRLDAASDSAEDAVARSLVWLQQTLGAFQFRASGRREAMVLARATHAIVSNATQAPGLLGGRIAAFPSRGRYPCHYLWDSCFQNLALEAMEPRLAEDSLLLLTANMRSDGKVPQFVCSTWVRPCESQPPLIGWAGLRLVTMRRNRDLAATLVPALRRNTEWWMSQRMTRYGLTYALGGLEMGWDDSPRFDDGAVVACDLNSYLVVQLRACADLARTIGDVAGAVRDDEMADRLAQKMVAVLYDTGTGLFWDISLNRGKPVRIKTPACFLPWWAGVPLSEGRTRRAIEQYLLNPAFFFGEVPFPSVAYSEVCYQPDKWWRGPVWPPVAYLMLELLEKHGYADEALAARKRLYRVIQIDGQLRELFNSKTGEGLGACQQGWTAAICLRLQAELSRQEHRANMAPLPATTGGER